MPPSDLSSSPDHYLYAVDGGDAVFLPMDRAAYARSIFLDQRIQPAGDIPTRVPLADLPTPAPSPPAGWILHIAHCGSTLLARALDRPGGGLVLREPVALRQLGVEAANTPAADRPGRLGLVTASLARRYEPAAMTITKANVPVNFMAPDLLAPGNAAIFLHFPLVPYLLAILRSPNHRNWVRFITDELRPAITAHAGPSPDDEPGRAAILWLAQIRAFAAAIKGFPNSRSLDAETLFSAPGAVIAAAGALFGQPIPPAEIAAIIAGPLFATYSKNPALAFDNKARAARESALGLQLAPELTAARRLIDTRLGDFPLPTRLPLPLVPSLAGRDLL